MESVQGKTRHLEHLTPTLNSENPQYLGISSHLFKCSTCDITISLSLAENIEIKKLICLIKYKEHIMSHSNVEQIWELGRWKCP